MLETVLLWLFVVFSGVAVGAGLYEMRIVVPQWFNGSAVRAALASTGWLLALKALSV